MYGLFVFVGICYTFVNIVPIKFGMYCVNSVPMVTCIVVWYIDVVDAFGQTIVWQMPVLCRVSQSLVLERWLYQSLYFIYSA